LIHNWFAEHFRFWPRVLLSSAIFGLGHFDSIGVVISSFVMGVVIAIAYERTQTLWLPIAIHAVTNSAAIVLLFVTLALGFETRFTIDRIVSIIGYRYQPIFTRGAYDQNTCVPL
jgi:membrane protease YdiL (CAAX protease family)